MPPVASLADLLVEALDFSISILLVVDFLLKLVLEEFELLELLDLDELDLLVDFLLVMILRKILC